MKFWIVAMVGLVGWDQQVDGTAERRRWAEEARKTWEGPCADRSWLLATTSGSPSSAQCPNKKHHMRVQVVTTSSNDEIGALVFCECARDEDEKAAAP